MSIKIKSNEYLKIKVLYRLYIKKFLNKLFISIICIFNTSILY